jgi:ABC-type Mn2+/Zn2+ transport system permease subunit
MNSETIIMMGTAIPTVCYTGVCMAYLFEHNPWNAMIWFGYAIANFGLMRISGVL